MSELSEKIFGIDDISRETVRVREWDNVAIEVRSIPLGQRNSIGTASRDKDGKTDTALYYPRMVIASCFVPGSEEKVFTMKDVERLQQRNAAAVDRLAKVAMKLAGITEEDEDKEAAAERAEAEVEEAGKDFSSTESSELGSL